MQIEAATEALSEDKAPAIGIDTKKSHFSRTRREMPSPSEPITRATGPFRFAL
jgi:hypothetical protein